MSSHKRKPLSASDRRMEQLKKANPGAFPNVKLRNTNNLANDENDNSASDERDKKR